MERSRVTELQFIAPITSLDSLCEHGIVSHRLAATLDHRSIANEGVQGIRAGKDVPGGQPLHDYANVYFDARNPMMSVLRDDNPDLVVLRISPEVLDLPGAVIADGNAARPETRFFPSPAGLANLDADFVFAEWWTDPDYFVKYEKKRRRMAELLVPERIPPDYLVGCYAYNKDRAQVCMNGAPSHWEVEVRRHAYF